MDIWYGSEELPYWNFSWFRCIFSFTSSGDIYIFSLWSSNLLFLAPLLITYQKRYIALKAFHFLERLNSWWTQGGSALASLLMNPHCCLKVLVLNNCQLGLAGVLQIIQALSGEKHYSGVCLFVFSLKSK